MTAFEEIKKALEGVTPGPWFDWETNEWLVDPSRLLRRYIDASFIARCDPIAISELLSTLESLQRENERLQAEIDRKSSMPGDHRHWEGRYRDEAAENEKLREALQNVRSEFRVEFNGEKIAGISHDSQSLPRIIGVLDTALASTGGEHHAE